MQVKGTRLFSRHAIRRFLRDRFEAWAQAQGHTRHDVRPDGRRRETTALNLNDEIRNNKLEPHRDRGDRRH